MGLLRAAGPTAPLQEPSSSVSHTPGLAEPENAREMLGGLGTASVQTESHGLREPRGPLELGKHLVPRSPPQSFPPKHQLRLLTANPGRDAFCSQAQALHVLLAVPPAANGNALQTLEGDNSNAEQ